MNNSLRSQIQEKRKNEPLPVGGLDIGKVAREEKPANRGYPYNTSYDPKPKYNEPDELGETKKVYPYQHTPDKRKDLTANLPRSSQQTNTQRTGMSDVAWRWVFNATEFALDVIKGVMIVGGIIASNLADFIMGSIGISLIINTKINTLTFVNGFGFGSILSMGASAIQIYMWSLIQKRGISAKWILTPRMWKNIPNDVRGFLWTALFLWAIDTLLDVSPTLVLFTPENFIGMTWLYNLLVISVMIIVTILCGFAEILTSNMRAMLAGSK